MPVKFGQNSIRFWLFLSYLITTVCNETFKYACEKGHSELVEAATLELLYIFR